MVGTNIRWKMDPKVYLMIRSFYLNSTLEGLRLATCNNACVCQNRGDGDGGLVNDRARLREMVSEVFIYSQRWIYWHKSSIHEVNVVMAGIEDWDGYDEI
jgi:hypothetical protein